LEEQKKEDEEREKRKKEQAEKPQSAPAPGPAENAKEPQTTDMFAPDAVFYASGTSVLPPPSSLI
jgi:hypothetical protein